MPQMKTLVQSKAVAIPMKVQPSSIVGLRGTMITLADASGKWTIQVPREAFADVEFLPGENAIVTFGLTRIAIEEVPDAIEPAFLMPGKTN